MSPSSSVLRLASPLLALLALALPAASAHADGYGLALRHGEAGVNYRGDGIALHLPPWWTGSKDNWTATLRPQIEYSQFRYDGGRAGPRHVDEAGAVGLFRLERSSGAIRPYAEAGIGLTAFSRSTLGSKDLSTHFQFTEQVGLGVRFAEHWFAGWRYSHYSNADIRQPNDGIDMQQIEIGIRF